MALDKKNLKPGSPKNTAVSMTQLVLPPHTNAFGNVFGGTLMSWMDVAASIAARKHCRQQVVTASFDALHFVKPIHLGDVVYVEAMVNYAGTTSMEVGVRVEVEDMKSGERTLCVTAYTTFVALDSQMKPAPVPPIDPETDEEKRRFQAAKVRRKHRMELAQMMKERQLSKKG